MVFYEGLCSKVGLARIGAVTIVAISVALTGAVAVAAGPLRYEPKAKQTFGYEVEITADMPDEIETCKGTISYEVTSAGNLLKLKYQGGLTKTTKVKEGARGNRHGGFPPPIPRGVPFGLFGGTSFGGLTRTSNVVTLTARGRVVALEGSSQLPYLLGNLSLFVFEPLPEDEQGSWTADTGVAVSENDNSSDWRGPFFHRAHNAQPDKTTAGSESTSFVAKGSQGDLSTFEKTYRLRSSDGKDELSVSGSGSWVFNRRLGISESLDFKSTLVNRENNVTLTIPVTVKYERISSEEWAKIEQERKDKEQQFQDEAKARLMELMGPLTDKGRREIIASLETSDEHALLKVLMPLSIRHKRHPDKKLAEALKPLLSHSNSMVRDLAGQALANFSPEFATHYEVNKDYSSSMPIDQTGALVTARTPLPHGLIVAAKRHRQWFAAKVLRTMPNGQVEVEFRNWHGDGEIVSRSDIRLAPPEVEQPYVEKKRLAAAKAGADAAGEEEDEAEEDEEDVASIREFRVWTDNTGTFAIVAKYAGIEGASVRLQRKKDDKEVKVPISRLSRADQKVIARLRDAAGVDNPFDP